MTPTPGRFRRGRRPARTGGNLVGVSLWARVDELECRALLSTISGHVYDDLDGDGSRDAGEPGLSGVTVYLDQNLNGSLDPGESSRVSDGSGSYRFDLSPGAYFVRQVAPPGRNQTEPVGGFHYVSLSGAQDVVRNFGNQSIEVGKAPIMGRAYHDLDSDGVKDANEPGLAGWTVFADLDNNAMPSPGEPSATTDAEGNYRMLVDPGRVYQIREDVPTGWALTAPPVGYHIVPVFSTRPVLGRDFGNIQVGGGDDEGVLNGQVYDDQDGDGVKDAGESGLAGWTVYLDQDEDGVLDPGEQSMLSNASGNYSFTVEPGSYQIREVVMPNWQQTAPVGGVHEVTVAADQTISGLDFGNKLAAGGSISGTVFQDIENLTTRDPGEPGLSGWTVYADLNNNSLLDSGEPSVLSGANGLYSLPLEPGTYRLREILMTGWIQTTPTRRFYDVALGPGQSVTGRDFGNFSLGNRTSSVAPPGSGAGVLGFSAAGSIPSEEFDTPAPHAEQGGSPDLALLDVAIADADASGVVLQAQSPSRLRPESTVRLGVAADAPSKADSPGVRNSIRLLL
nr:SdrD B-like domain-containing protein [Tautonia plasticadhaerens]